MIGKDAMPKSDLELLCALERKILSLATWTVHNANHLRDTGDGLKVGGTKLPPPPSPPS